MTLKISYPFLYSNQEVFDEQPLGGHHHQPQVPDILSHENDVEPETIIHPGGSENLDIHKVEFNYYFENRTIHAFTWPSVKSYD